MNSTINPPEDHLQWNAQEVSSIIVIFSLFLILSYYSVVRPICCRTSSSRSLQAHHQRRHLLEDSTIDEFQSHGLEMSVIQSLPISRFKKKKSEEGEDDEKVNSNNNTDCAICLGEFEEGERLKHLPNCNHVFHVLCIDSWFRCHSDCPLCRSHVHLGDDDGNLTSINLECSIDSYTLMETLRREDFSQERTSHHHHHHHQFIHSETSGD